MNSPELYHYHIPKLTLLQTDVSEPELLFRRMALETLGSRKLPGDAENCYVYYRMKYEAPEQDFSGLRRLLLEIRGKTGMRSCFKGIVGINVTSWKGHEAEEYFQIFEKYLYDNSDEWELVFICSAYSDREFAELQYNCVNYFMIEKKQRFIYETDHLERCIKESVASFGLTAEEEGIRRLGEILQSDEMKNYRSLQMINRMVYELLARNELSAGSVITDRMVRRYLDNPTSVLSILMRRSLTGDADDSKEVV